jgi:hypothetical protein
MPATRPMRRQAINSFVFMRRYFLHGSQSALYLQNPGTAAWPAAGRALYLPVELDRPMLVTKLFVHNGTTAPSGTWDMGLYDDGGLRLINAGATAQGASSTLQTFDIPDTRLDRGLYYLAIVASTTPGVYAFTGGVSIDWKCWGALQQASATPLPATATFASNTTAFLPWIGLTGFTVV